MDSCRDDALKLDYLNGLLSGKARALFEGHLAACPGCRREIAELRKTAAAVAGLTAPSVPEAWTAAAKARLRAETRSAGAAVPPGPAAARRGSGALRYALIAAGVTGTLVLLLWLVLAGTVRRWLPGLSADALGISAPRAARTVDLIAWVLSLHALAVVPSIIDGIYRVARGRGRR
jgi:anti-sigma factor RsiW